MSQLWLRNKNNINSNFTTEGEKFFAEKLSKLNDSWCIWHEPGIPGINNRPDFLLIHPLEGIILIEVKDWIPTTIKSVNKDYVEKFSKKERKTFQEEKNPYTQAEESFYKIKNTLEKAKVLLETADEHKGNLKVPYGFGVFFYNINRQTLVDNNWQEVFGVEKREYRDIICIDEIKSLISGNEIQDRLRLLLPDFSNRPRLTKEELNDFCEAVKLPKNHLDFNKITAFKSNSSKIEIPKKPRIVKSYSIGLDFGTTNSIVSYLDNEHLKAFRYGGGAACSEYIPSFVAYEGEDILIGAEARSAIFDDDIKTFGNFKMSLPLPQDQVLQKFPKEFAPVKLTADYLSKLLLSKDNDCSFRKQKGAIDGIVVSVPEIWLRDPSNRGRENLRKVIRENLGLGEELIQLVSEPVAAAAYYAWKIHQDEADFSGNVLVCDMGGGTFDISLCRVYLDNKIRVLYYDGKGEKGLESAGVAFDRNCVRKAIAKKGKSINEDSKEFKKLAKEFETHKIAQHGNFTRKIKKYYQDTSEYANSKCYPFADGYSLTFQEVVDAFEPIKEEIQKTIEKVCQYIKKQENIKIDRIFFAGGFCQFYPVQKAILDSLDVVNDAKSIVDEKIDLENSAYAISYGACLIANGLSDPIEEYAHSIGLWAETISETEGHHNQFIRIIKGGESVEELTSPQFVNRIFETFSSRPLVNLGVQVNSQGEVKHKEISDLVTLPQSLSRQPKWKIGMRVDRSQICYLIVEEFFEDKNYPKNRFEYELGDVKIGRAHV